MKIKYIEAQSQELYIGYYRNKILCMHQNKEIVKTYLTINRKLMDDEYEIKKETIREIDLCLKYEDYIIVEYNKFYIPNIDTVVIEMDCSNLHKELETTIDRVKDLVFKISHIEKDKANIKILVSAINILTSFNKNKKYKKLYKESTKYHPILYCNIQEYFQYIEYINSYRNNQIRNSAYAFNNDV